MTGLSFVERAMAETGVPYQPSELWEVEPVEEALNHEPDHSCCDPEDRPVTGSEAGPCPRCGAPVGSRCRYLDRKRPQWRGRERAPHSSRIERGPSA